MIKNILLIISLIFFSSYSFSKDIYNEKKTIDEIVKENNEFPHYEVGSSFLYGIKIKQDFEKSMFWLKKSSEVENNSRADFLLGQMYSYGFTADGSKDSKKALFYYEKSANNDNTEAKLKTAFHYLYNERVLNQEKGLFWLKEAMGDNDLTAYQLYASLLVTAKDQQSILKQLDLVLARSTKGDHLSSFYLGLIYLKNTIVERNLKESKIYFLKAAQQGNLLAEDFIALIDKVNNTN